MQIFAHRGYSSLWPENTRQAAQAAYAAGAHGVEVDIQRTQDSVILLHDDTLERTALGALSSGELLGRDMLTTDVNKLSLAQTQKVNVGSLQSPEAPPQLLDFLRDWQQAMVKYEKDFGLLIELKGGDFAMVPCFAEVINSFLEVHPYLNPQLITCIGFDAELMHKVKQALPQLRHAIVYEQQDTNTQALVTAKALGMSGVDFEVSDSVSADLVAQAHEQGLQVITWVSRAKQTDGEAWAQRMRQVGVDVFTSDLPESICRGLGGNAV